jgi:isocitrate/isopropylmalate dehydrogenase
MSDGMFLHACRQVAKEYPHITYDEDLLDRACLRIVQDPSPYADRVMVMPNLYGEWTTAARREAARRTDEPAMCACQPDGY